MKVKIATISFGVLFFIIISSLTSPAQIKRVDVRFKTGSNSSTYSNSVTGYGTVDFYLRANGGQQMSVKLNSSNTFLYFNVLRGSGDGEIVADDAREITEWSGELPDNGTYVVRVFLVRAEARRNKRPVTFKVNIGIK